MTLIELMVVLAVGGILVGMGVASMVDLIEAERARNEAVRFATQIRRQRAEAMQQQMYTLVEVAPAGGNGTKVIISAKRIGAAGTTPCEQMQAGDADVVRSTTYAAVNVSLSTELQPTARRLCLDPYGKPMTTALQVNPAEFTVTHEGEQKLSLSIDALGALASTDQPVASGIAQTSFFPLDLMTPESAPVPPNIEDVPELPIYEVAPGEYVDADGTPTSDGSLGGTDDPCLYDASYCDPCVVDPYGPSCPCGPADPYCTLSCDPYTGICPVVP